MEETTSKQEWKMPSWMEPYRELIGNTGGHSVEELYNDKKTNAQTNLVLAALIISVSDQVSLLYRLKNEGLLKEAGEESNDEDPD